MPSIPSITGSQMAQIDAIMMNDVGVNTFQLMELAGYMVAEAARKHLRTTTPQRILALAGTGGNGGDAMVAARFLAGWGHDCTVLLTRQHHGYTGIAAHQLAALDQLHIPVIEPAELESLPEADLIIDGLLGFNLHGNPRGEAARLIALANAHPAPTLAIDISSGLNADTGEVGDPCIQATLTVTLALPKTGLMMAPPEITGQILLADIGVPPQVYGRIGVEVAGNLFARSSLLTIRGDR
ncbi:MAG: NAD(P)H-hydrate epimerase [Thermomicrobiales bacterium]|nr:NAD(P)H-hydrate epimerase [Thermomicrobiales bacterium]